jgi:hypothetical protein
MFEVQGKYNTAKIFTDVVDSAKVAKYDLCRIFTPVQDVLLVLP